MLLLTDSTADALNIASKIDKPIQIAAVILIGFFIIIIAFIRAEKKSPQMDRLAVIVIKGVLVFAAILLLVILIYLVPRITREDKSAGSEPTDSLRTDNHPNISIPKSPIINPLPAKDSADIVNTLNNYFEQLTDGITETEFNSIESNIYALFTSNNVQVNYWNGDTHIKYSPLKETVFDIYSTRNKIVIKRVEFSKNRKIDAIEVSEIN